MKEDHAVVHPQTSEMNSENSGVGYSFASEFNSKITSNANMPK